MQNIVPVVDRFNKLWIYSVGLLGSAVDEGSSFVKYVFENT